jgi:hypothetical protein
MGHDDVMGTARSPSICANQHNGITFRDQGNRFTGGLDVVSTNQAKRSKYKERCGSAC